MRVWYCCLAIFTVMLHQPFSPNVCKVSSTKSIWFSSKFRYLHCYTNENGSLLNLKYECNLIYIAVCAINHLKHCQIFFALFVVEQKSLSTFNIMFNSSFISLEILQWIQAWNWFDAFLCTKYKFQKIWLKTT